MKTPAIKKGFPSTKYDEEYYLTKMTPGFRRHFAINKGRKLVPHRMNDLDFVKIRSGMKLLDLGCGRGELVMFCGSKGINSYGVEYSEAGLQLGKKCCRAFYSDEELKNIHLIRASVTDLPFPDSYFDRVMSWEVMEHLYLWQLEQFFKEIFRVLKKDGIAVLDTSPNEWYQYKAYRFMKPFIQLFQPRRRLPTVDEIRSNDLKTGHLNLLNPVSLKKNLNKGGFTCRIHLLRRNEFRAIGIYRFIGMAIESIPGIRAFSRQRLVAVASKSTSAMKTYASLPTTRMDLM